MIRESKYAVCSILAAVVLISGCSQELAQPTPVNAIVDAQTPNLWYYNWSSQQDIPVENISDIFFVFVYKGRDWRDGEGIDGYMLRVVLLDQDGRATRGDGWIKVFAVENSDTDRANAFAAWTLNPQQTKLYYNDERFPSYLLPLDWADGPQSRNGMFTIVLRWESPDKKNRYTRVIELEDTVAHEVQTTKKEFPSVVGRRSNDSDSAGSRSESDK